MGALRTYVMLFGAVALLLTGCGDEGGGGGTGGAGATGGVGGGGEGGAGGGGGSDIPDDGKPRVDALSPDKAGPGFRIRVEGANLNNIAPRNQLIFAGVDGTPSLSSPGVRADPDGTWFEADVPAHAKSGPTLITVEMDGSSYSVAGPEFTVTDDKLAPIISSISPQTITAGARPVTVAISGIGFYENLTTLSLNGEDFPIDWRESDTKKIVFRLSPEMVESKATYEVRLHTPSPGGGEAGPDLVRVVDPINVVKAKATGRTEVVLTFDQPVDPARASSRNSFSVVGGGRRSITSARVVSGAPHQVEVELANPVMPNRERTIEVADSFLSAEGGAIRERQVTFRTFGSLPLLTAEFGALPGCGADAFLDPTGVIFDGETFYVTEHGGNQVQTLDASLSFGGFYGHDGISMALHEAGEASGCNANPAHADGLSSPLGSVVLHHGQVIVGDTGNSRVVSLGATGASVLIDELPDPVVVLGAIDTPNVKGLLVTSGPGNVIVVDPTTGAASDFLGRVDGATGTGPNDLDLSLDEGGIPAIVASHNDTFQFLLEPGNHRVHRYTAAFASAGSIGAGARNFGENATGEAGDEDGSFRAPAGLVVDPFGSLYVVDEGGESAGRLQRFSPSGAHSWSLALDYVPGGVAVDAERDLLWITNRTNGTLMQYQLP